MKLKRHFTITEIISNQRITTQDELCEALQENGFAVTQATVSRDIKELQLIKIPDDEGYRYALPDAANITRSQERLRRIFSDSVITMDYSENLIVIKTLPGGAQSVASVIDSSDFPNILGTVAGDDAIFVVVKPIEAVPEVLKGFQELI
ncbi:MAG: arginine repressor [Syntrophomonadaceae bacterium]|nr:arginine repressor [Syntrophomonadaceae bacterium]